MFASRENFPLLAELLAEQQRLDTPVARFSSAHDAGADVEVTALTKQLIPLSKPGPGEQYAFEVELDSCTGCKSCVAACHSLNGLDETETWRDVGMLVSPHRAHPFTQTVTSACHHCADPACLNGCPVLAYEKDPVTGIVRHLDDQCIGCSYCILKCPYDVPKYSSRLGIVRKCDMCHGRLSEGEAPACAQACPTQAIRIVTVKAPFETGNRRPETHSKPETGNRKPETATQSVRSLSAKSARSNTEEAGLPAQVGGSRFPVSGFRSPVLEGFLPGTADPAYTRPTTRYVSRRKLPEYLVAADAAALRPQPPHWPLVWMLTLLPVSLGLLTTAALSQPDSIWLKGLAVALGGVGLAASVFHLGQPRRAWRIFLGWRTSWLSREAMIFGAWFPLAAATLVAPQLLSSAVLVGFVGLACSTMIYIDTRRQFWRAEQTVARFFGTSALVTSALLLPKLCAVLLLAKLAWESRSHFDHSIAARLQRGPLARAVFARDLLGLGSLCLLLTNTMWVALPMLIAGELAERYLFFRAVDAPKMPGVPA
jgi:formate dehydrogenase iron-sulfur subunit